MRIERAGSRATRRASADWFTGTVWQDPIVEAEAPGRLRALLVHFEPGARTNWHTHPLGQTLLVTTGLGRVQRWGEPILEVRPGDVVWIAAGEKHWHGAAKNVAMSHVAMQEAQDGVSANWLEPVTEEQYEGSAGL